MKPRPHELETLLRDLKHPEHHVRRNLIRYLFYSQDPRAPALLSRMVNGDGDSHIRFLARKALHLLERRATVAPRSSRMSVTERIRSPDAGVRQTAVADLARLREPDAFAVLQELLSLESNPLVRASAARALAIVGGIEAIPGLRTLLADDSERVRAAAVEGLAELARPETCRDVLVMIGDSDPRVQLAARRAVLCYGLGQVYGTLASFSRSGSPLVRGAMVRILDRLRIADLNELLERARNDSSEEVRRAAAAVRPGSCITDNIDVSRVLAALGSDGLDEPVVDPLESPDPIIRKDEVREIVQRRLLTRIPNVADRIPREQDNSIRATLVITLGILKARDRRQVLEEALRDTDDRVRANAVEALGMLDEPSVVKGLLPLLKDPCPRVRANTIVALKRTRGIDIVAPLKEMVESNDLRMICSAVYAISDVNSSSVTLLLKPLLNHHSPTIRSRAAEALEIMRRHGNLVAGALLAESPTAAISPGGGLDFTEQEWEEGLE